MGGKSKQPETPDYGGLARLETYVNRPTQNTPWGRSSWANDGDRWTQNITLDPQLQNALDAQQWQQTQRTRTANTALQQYRQQGAFNLNGLPEYGNVPDVPTVDFAPVAEARDEYQNQLLERLRPTQERELAAMESRLGNMGLSMDSERHDREMQGLRDQHSRDQYNAVAMAGDEMQRMYGIERDRVVTPFSLGLQAQGAQDQQRQRALTERAIVRSMPLQELQQLMAGQNVQYPNFGTFNPGGDLMGANQASYQSQLGAYNAQQAQQGQTAQSAAQLGMLAYLMSDYRLKDLRPLDFDPVEVIRAIKLHRFDYKNGDPGYGVIAHELQDVVPPAIEAVIGKKDGDAYQRVNYAALIPALIASIQYLLEKSDANERPAVVHEPDDAAGADAATGPASQSSPAGSDAVSAAPRAADATDKEADVSAGTGSVAT